MAKATIRIKETGETATAQGRTLMEALLHAIALLKPQPAEPTKPSPPDTSLL